MPLRYLTLILLLATPAYAWPPIFGPEYTFSSDEINACEGKLLNCAPLVAAMDAFEAEAIRNCRTLGCRVVVIPHTETEEGMEFKHVELHFEDGFSIKVAFDPKVLEVTHAPLTTARLREKQNLVENAVFTAMKNIGLSAVKSFGGGHDNIGVKSAFGTDAEHFQRFFADFSRRSFVTDQIFGMIGNESGKNFRDLSVTTRRKISMALAMKEVTLDEVIDEIVSAYYLTDSSLYAVDLLKSIGLSLQNHLGFPNEVRAEMRNHLPQLSAAQFTLQSEFYEAWIAFHRDRTELPFLDPRLVRLPPLSQQEVFNAFCAMLEDFRLKRNRYLPLLPFDTAGMTPSADYRKFGYKNQLCGELM